MPQRWFYISANCNFRGVRHRAVLMASHTLHSKTWKITQRHGHNNASGGVFLFGDKRRPASGAHQS